MINERLIRVHADNAAFSFTSDKELATFQYALGKIVSYGMKSDKPGFRHMELTVTADQNIVASCYPLVPEPMDARSSKPYLELGNAINGFSQGNARRLTAIKQPAGNYQFQS